MANDVIVSISFDPKTGQLKRVLDGVETAVGKSGKRSGDNFEKGFKSGVGDAFKSFRNQAVAAIGFVATAFAGKRIIEASARQQEAVNNLNASLARIGEFSSEVSQDLQDYASQLQSVTKIGDEAALEQLAFAQGLGATAEQSKAVVSAAADLAAGLNIDLNSATRNVAKTLGGFAGELGEIVPELKNLTKEQLQSGAAIDLLGEKFRGLAAAQINTFSGSLEQLQNLFGDLLEAIGDIVTSSPSLVAVFKVVGNGISNLIGSLNRVRQGGDALQPLLVRLIDIGRFLNNFTPILVGVGRVASVVFNGIGTGINAIKAALGQLGVAAARVLDFFGKGKGISDALKSVGEETAIAFTESLAPTQEAIDNLFEPTALQEKIDGFLNEVNRAAVESQEPLEMIANNAKKTNVEVTRSFAQTGKAIASTVKSAIVGSISKGIQVLANNLVAGKGLFDDFGKFVLGTLGDLAIKVGELAIAFGITTGAISSLSPGVAIAAGAALIAIGSVVKALSAGKGGLEGTAGVAGAGPDIGGIASASVASPGGGDLTGADDGEGGRSTSVAVNIQGDVLDSRETGLRIVSLINDSFEQDGSVVTNGSFA